MKKAAVLILVAVILLTVAVVTEAQQPTKVPRIGLLSGLRPCPMPPTTEAFRQGLRELGYVEGQNILVEYRWAEGKADRYAILAAELVRLGVDVIVTQGTQRPSLPSKQPTRFLLLQVVLAILSPKAWFPVWRDQAETLRDLLTSTRI